MMRIAAVGLALMIAASAAHAQVPTDNPQASKLDKTVDAAATEFFKAGCHVGLSIDVYNKGQTSFYGYGTVDKQHPSAPSKTSIFEIGSITKTFTGALAAQAKSDGKMTLDGDFRPLLGGGYPNLEKDGKPITLRTLATHRSGMPKDIPNSDALFKAPDIEKLPGQMIALEKDYDRARYLDELHGVSLARTPGDEPAVYSNIGVKLIGFGLENAYGQSLDQLLRRFIVAPLKMTRTGFSVAPANKASLTIPYTPGGAVAPYHLDNAGASGGIYSTAEDMLKYAAWHLDETQPVIRAAHEVLAGDTTKGEALIWQLSAVNGERVVSHSGGVYGSSAQLLLFPDSNIAIVLLANDGCLPTQNQLRLVGYAARAGLN